MDRATARKIKSKSSKIERVLAKAMWSIGLRYRKHCRDVAGTPDFCFKQKKIAVFCDSEFWHGYNFVEKGERFKTNSEFWEKKILRNMERDREVNKILATEGWKVIRFWGKEILKTPHECAEKVKIVYDSRSV